MGNGASDEGVPVPASEPDAFSGPASVLRTHKDWSPPAYTSSSITEELLPIGASATAHLAPPAANTAAATPPAARRRGSSGVVIVREGTDLEVSALRGLE